ncbi:MAG: hypothetical protein WKF84_08110 [Pyrinomonadaceae bacterium]
MWKYTGTDEELWEELVFCIFTAGASALWDCAPWMLSGLLLQEEVRISNWPG